jgi:protein-disulfide isomerase
VKGLPTRHLLGLLLVILLGWGVGLLVGRAVPIGVDISDNTAARAVQSDRDAPTAEVAAATLTLVEFTDYQCPACRKADPAMTEAVLRDGMIRVRFRDYPIFGARSVRAARVAISAARQGIYPAVHHRLMTERRPLDDAVLREAVEASGGDWPRLLRDLETHGPRIEAQLATTRRHAAAIGVAGTPSYLAGSILVVGALDVAGFERLFARARESMPFE